jgi:hypothetical protein
MTGLVRLDGSITTVVTLRAVYGPALVTVAVHLTVAPTVIGPEHDTPIPRFAGAAPAGLTVTVNVAVLALGRIPLEAVTLHLNDLVPEGGTPLSAPVVALIVNHGGCPDRL